MSGAQCSEPGRDRRRINQSPLRVFLVTPSNEWRELSRLILRVKTPAGANAAQGQSGGQAQHSAANPTQVDAAQLAPHRRIDIRADNDPEHIDFVALSAHKMYAPFGAGALVGPREIFLQGAPEYQGGGTVELVTLGYVRWAELPDREEAGSPNFVGAIAMAMTAQAKSSSEPNAYGCKHFYDNEKRRLGIVAAH